MFGIKKPVVIDSKNSIELYFPVNITYENNKYKQIILTVQLMAM